MRFRSIKPRVLLHLSVTDLIVDQCVEESMTALKSLNPKGLPGTFSLENYGERPIIALSFHDRSIRISYTFPGFSFADLSKRAGRGPSSSAGQAFPHEVGISGTGFLSESGKPLLPSFGRFLQIPSNHDYKIHISKHGMRKHPNIKIKPAQENTKDQNAGTFEFHDQTYKKNKYYPDQVVEISRPFYLDGYRVLCIHVRPLQYNPVKQLLRGFSNIRVTIEFSEKDRAPEDQASNGEMAPWNYLDGGRNLEGFGNFLFNPERKYFAKAGLRPPIVHTAETRPDIPDFLILYGDTFLEPARKLQSWKQKMGLDTRIVPVGRIIDPDGRSDSPEDPAQKIKAYIRALRRVPRSPLRYVLLLGDISRIPTEERQRPGTSGTSLSDTTDYYYFTHRDASGEECLLPWIAGGRIPARDEKEAHSVVDQIIRYEKKPPDDPDYFGRMTVAAYFEDCDPNGRQDGRANHAYMKTMETIREHMVSHGFDVRRVYISNNRNPVQYSDGTPVPMELKAELLYKTDGPIATKRLIGLINEGQLIIGHRGHGDRKGWLNPPLRTEDLPDVSTTSPSVFFSINCRTGSFDAGRECFAEGVLALNGGAPSLIASTELSGSWRNDSMIKALFDAIWPGVIPTYPVTTMRFPVKYYRMGDILTYAKAYLLIAHGLNANTQKHFEIYHVVGDPTLQIWGSEPISLRLRARIKQDILVVNMNTCPKEAALSLWFEDECLLKLAPSGTRMAIPLMMLDKLPADAQNAAREGIYKLSLYFSAPGHRMAESHLWF
jgi:hypothetical protein